MSDASTSTTPPGLTPGPDGTFYGPLRCVPYGWESRITEGGRWVKANNPGSCAIVQARPEA